MTSCDIVKKYSWLKFVTLELAFVKASNCLPRSKKTVFEKFVFNYEVILTSRTYDTHSEKMINRGKFNVRKRCNFRGVKTRHTDTQPDRHNCALYLRPAGVARQGPSISNVGVYHFGSTGCAGFTHRALCEQQPKVNELHALLQFSTRNCDHHIYLIMTGNDHEESCDGEGSEAQSKLIAPVKWGLLSQLQK